MRDAHWWLEFRRVLCGSAVGIRTSTSTAPRAMFVTLESDYQLLLARHATREQARFYLETRGQKFSELETRHDRFQAVLRQARAAVPTDWRQTHVRRADQIGSASCRDSVCQYV